MNPPVSVWILVMVVALLSVSRGPLIVSVARTGRLAWLPQSRMTDA